MLTQQVTVLVAQTLKSRKRTELHQGQGHTQVRDIPEHHREVWGLVDPNLQRQTDLPQGQGHRQAEGIQGTTPLKGCIDVTAKGQVQSLGHTQVQCQGQDQLSAIQGSLRKKLRRKKYDSSTSASRSRSAEHRSRNSDTKVKNKKKQDSSRSDSSSKLVRHSSRKSDYKTKKSKS